MPIVPERADHALTKPLLISPRKGLIRQIHRLRTDESFNSLPGSFLMVVHRILIVRLPCKKVYPTGPIYLMSLLRKAAPALSLKVLDLALLSPKRQKKELDAAIQAFGPDVIAFSWRDIQIFSPQDLDTAMRDAFIWFHDPSLANKAKASLRGLKHIATYRSGISRNLDLIRQTAETFPSAEIALGGPAVRIFPYWLRERIPGRVRLFAQDDLMRFIRWLGLDGPRDLVEPYLDFEALEAAFPQWKAYQGDVIGVRTKQGCPLGCLFCAYGFLEGKEVRRRDPSRVVREVAGYVQRWGARRFWFTDAQLLSGPGDREHLEAVLRGLMCLGADIRWSGYLRIHGIDRDLADLMVRSGLHDLEVSLNSGSQKVLDQLRMGFSAEEVIRGIEVLKSAGYPGRLLLNLSLNAPGETRETLRETLGAVERIRGIFGKDRVVPVIFFLAIQPRTGLEMRALADGHIKEGYHPLSVSPWNVLNLIYNPPPLGRLIGRCCARAFRDAEGGAGGRILCEIEKELTAGGRDR